MTHIPSDSAPPESRAPEALQPDVRDALGRFRRGVSGNPGGISKAVLEARQAFAKDVDRAREVLHQLLEEDAWGGRVAAAGMILDRALGKASSPSELPTDSQLAEPQESSPRALLDRTLKLLERSIASAEQQVTEGQPLSEAQREALREDAQTLSGLLKAERELSASGAGAELSDEALVAKVLAALPMERLEAAVAARKATP